MEELRDEPYAVDLIESGTAFAGMVWDIRADRFRYGDGELTRQYMDHPGAAAVLALDDDGRVLLIQQYRHPIRERDWEIPAGLLDVPGESPVDAARRELAEEADLEASRWELLSSVHLSPGGSSELTHLFLARGLRPAAQPHPRVAEEADIRVAWVPLADAVRAVTDGRFRNATTGMALLLTAARVHEG